jgi:hypothetical protein
MLDSFGFIKSSSRLFEECGPTLPRRFCSALPGVPFLSAKGVGIFSEWLSLNLEETAEKGDCCETENGFPSALFYCAAELFCLLAVSRRRFLKWFVARRFYFSPSSSKALL